MKQKKCISCGFKIRKSSYSDPYTCRNCEEVLPDKEPRYAYLDNA